MSAPTRCQMPTKTQDSLLERLGENWPEVDFHQQNNLEFAFHMKHW